MSPALTFFVGLLLLILFGWYLASDLPARKRWLGLVLSVLLVAFCLEQTIPPSKRIRLGLDLQGGTSFLIRLAPLGDEAISSDLLGQAVEVIRKRVDAYGVSEPVITPQGSDRILVQIPGLDTKQIEATKAELQRVAKLELATVAGGGDRIARIEAGEEIMPPGYVIKVYKDKIEGKEQEFKLLVKRRPELSGEHVKRAHAFFDQQGYGVSLSLDAEGAKTFGDLTQSLAPTRGQIAILLDGEVQSAPHVNEPIYGGNAVITGRFTEKQARDLASALENPLRVPVEVEETRSVSPTLGTDSIRSGILAGLTGLVLVFAFVMVYYRMAGVVAFIGLLVNMVILFGAMAMFNFVLTLPGIAGVILTMGMAVDANVLIYERLREETAAGKSLATALEAAYDKAFSAIFDANVTTLITAVILFWQATGSVRGFAITLTLGIVASMFSALLVTRTIFRWLIERFGLKKLTMLDLIPKRKFNFLGQRVIAAIVSAVLIGGSIIVFAVRGETNFGIDFRGGDLLVVDSKQPLTVAEARQTLEGIGLGDVVIQFEREGLQDRLSVRSPQGTSAKILAKLQETFPNRDVIAVSQENVGPQIGLEFAKKAALALAFGMIGILIYVTLRFEFSFALGAVAALLHDVIITMGVFSLIGGELSLVMVGAILTIAGYSINDTIVVFDRIREGLKNKERGSIQMLMNTSINETLGRTILT
ncbi:MAG TPA: protein translocase subunit SecD, partial [Terrimicrobiaceae bacterium]|nr:protein translocase subunit SecD [Terrimicrobiaceae bacterium]